MRRSRRPKLGCFIALAAALSLSVQSGAPARAATAAAAESESQRGTDRDAPSPADRAAAQALFDEGRALMRRGRAVEACSRFEASDRLESGLGTRFHLARCYEAVGKLASAHALFLRVAAESAARGQPERERVARERAHAVEPRLARLTIDVPFASSPELRIQRDGVLVADAAWGVAIPVDPGVHRVTAAAPGYEPWVAEVVIPTGGGVTRLDVPPLAEQRQPFFAPTSRKLGLAALGVGAGAIALGGVFAVQAASRNEASEREGCSDDSCPTQAGLSLRREALRAGDRATWAMGAGLLGIGTAAALFWIWPTPEVEAMGSLSVSPVLGANRAGLNVEGRF